MAGKQKRRPTPKRKWQRLMLCEPADPQKYAAHGLTVPDAIYKNDLYSVFVRNIGNGAMHVSFHRHDRAAVRDWRHFQAIKNEVGGFESTAIEIFPPESKLVDTSNEYHLWILPPNFEMPFGFSDADGLLMNQDEVDASLGGKTKARQRDWEEAIPTGRGIPDYERLSL